MQRLLCPPRNKWQKDVEALGLTWHTHADGTLYWDESICYVFSATEVDEIEQATNDLHQLCLRAVEHVVMQDRLAELGIPAAAMPLIKRSWQDRLPSLYGRFDLAYDGFGPPKLLEYNADTPTGLLEAAVIQYYWLQSERPHSDQFNSLWEALVDQWKALQACSSLHMSAPLYAAYSGPEYGEDHMTVACMIQETAKEAGIASHSIHMQDIGWNTRRGFVSLEDAPIQTIFKLFPWEWMWNEPFHIHLSESYLKTRWIEPPWKMILSSKGLLPLLWELFPRHPNLLAASCDPSAVRMNYVQKPFFSREGANVKIVCDGVTLQESQGTYDDKACVYQEYHALPDFQGQHPVVGSWIIGNEAHGMGIRESSRLITDNLSRFVPHYFE